MNKAYKFEQQQQPNNKWALVCVSHEHFPIIEACKDKTYKVRGSNGKIRIERNFDSAMKFAMEEQPNYLTVPAVFSHLITVKNIAEEVSALQ